MNTEAQQFFETVFVQLTKHEPYPWQRELFIRIARGEWPEVLDLPTGTGKTAVMQIWLAALGWARKTGAAGVPRRLAWVVNRRVVVDQVTEEIITLVDKRWKECPLLCELLGQQPPAVSTLRGQRADNGEWARDPSRPAVIVGTVDMIGSRLLFRGYRSSGYFRPMHAGLLAVDTLIVNDEAHLSPAFAKLVEDVQRRKPAARLPGKYSRILFLSATPGEFALRRFEHSPEIDTHESSQFKHVFEAAKTLTLHAADNKKSLDTTFWNLTITDPPLRTVVFIEAPEDAAKFTGKLEEHAGVAKRVALMTGTIRGWERDALARGEPFCHFLQPEYIGDPVWLVATSAAEVGVNLTCERMITGLVEADRLLQRFGRLNRFGAGTGEAHVVYKEPKGPKEERQQATLAYLQTLGGDISCKKLWYNKPPIEARSEVPAMACLFDHQLEIWSQTTYPDRELEAVASWLHGKQDNRPETEVAWRDDVSIWQQWELPDSDVRNILDRYPLRPHEVLREPSWRVLEKLEKLAGSTEDPEKTKVVLLDTDGSPQFVSLMSKPRDGGEAELLGGRDLEFKTLILPAGVGSVPRGMLSGGVAGPYDEPWDVADGVAQERSRYRISGDGEGEDVWSRIGSKEESRIGASDRDALVKFAAGHGYKAPLVILHPNDPKQKLVYFATSLRAKHKLVDVTLADHRQEVARTARALAERLELGPLVALYQQAGELHDEGKDNQVWQNAIGRKEGDPPLAKGKAPFRAQIRYRHELGSLIKALNANPSHEDLLLHLISSHHRSSRPYFTTRQFDPEEEADCHRVTLEAAQRFARLQLEFGPWGLAYLEAIFKCADGLASEEEGGAVSE